MNERVVLIGKPACHLCDEARVVVARVCAQFGVAWREDSILDDPALADEFAEQIPVVQVDGRTFDFWRIDEVRLRERLSGPQ